MRPHAAHLPAKILRAELLERRPDAEVEVLDCLALAGGLVERAINGASYESDFANRLFDVERRHSMTPAPADAVKVMTRNLFLGADLRPVSLALADPERLAEVPGVVAAIFNPGEPPGVVQRTDFARRAIAIAREIEATRPDLIGLQEGRCVSHPSYAGLPPW